MIWNPSPSTSSLTGTCRLESRCTTRFVTAGGTGVRIKTTGTSMNNPTPEQRQAAEEVIRNVLDRCNCDLDPGFLCNRCQVEKDVASLLAQREAKALEEAPFVDPVWIEAEKRRAAHDAAESVVKAVEEDRAQSREGSHAYEMLASAVEAARLAAEKYRPNN